MRRTPAKHPQSRYGQTQQGQRRGFGYGTDAQVVKVHRRRGAIAIYDKTRAHESLSVERRWESPILLSQRLRYGAGKHLATGELGAIQFHILATPWKILNVSARTRIDIR